jgi:hypothetical protein
MLFSLPLQQPVLAEDSSARSRCATAAKAAERIMAKRQAGDDILELFEVIDTAPGEEFKALLEGLATMAYDRPRYNTEEYRREAISEFKSRVMIECLKRN